VPFERVESIEGKSAIVIDGRPLRLTSLASLLFGGEAALKLQGDVLAVAVLTAGPASMGVAVDAFVSEIEAVVKRVRGGAERVALVAGAILAGDGSIVLVLDPAEIWRRMRAASGEAVLKAERAAPARRTPAILVVDDSVTTRTLEKSILEAHGYHVLIAVDGEDALQKLRSETVDLAIVDLQMPRMDGFQLIEQTKKDPRLAKLPVIIVTSVESRQEKERGLALGADAYIIKRKFDHKGLLETIRQIL
jgi:two-component system chemotaxis sensor kinase CheA